MLQTITRNFVQTISRNVIGLFGFPLILLYILAYRFMGVHTTYHWGDIDVRPTTPVTPNQFLFSRVFPLIVTVLATVIIFWFVGEG